MLIWEKIIITLAFKLSKYNCPKIIILKMLKYNIL